MNLACGYVPRPVKELGWHSCVAVLLIQLLCYTPSCTKHCSRKGCLVWELLRRTSLQLEAGRGTFRKGWKDL